ncbi:MAG: argininosuccinate lyase [Deltaproteobacteria bacterium]|nr:MAG: argininosuccinate lyase [Deltaproteobacteria bacterium]
MAKKTWGGRFKEDADELVDRFSASIGFDRRLYKEDIQGSIAHCKALTKAGIFTQQDCDRVIEALGQIQQELDRSEYPDERAYEDIHTLVERALVAKVGELGERLHTGRSRNDQVALDVRLYVREAINRIRSLIRETQRALVEQAEKHSGLIMPGYTHMQRAQPVLLAHHLMAYYEMFERDWRRFGETLKRTNVLPLGSAALAGTTFTLDREMMARELGFEAISANSMDAVSDRDFILEFLFDCAMVMMHLSRLSEELVIWSTEEFGFVTISDAFCTGSSIMPQKKNPDLPELMRGKTGRVYGHLISLLTVMKALPLAYNKDMQEDKEALFDTVDTLELCLEVACRLIGAVTFNGEKMKQAASNGFLVATDLAEYLVRKGVAFRKSHEIVGQLVLECLEKGKELHELSLEEMRSLCPSIGEDVYEWLDPAKSVERRNLPGGTGPDAVSQCIQKAKEELGL